MTTPAQLAAAYGLTTADRIAPPPPRAPQEPGNAFPLVKDTPKRPRRAWFEKDAEAEDGAVFMCLMGYSYAMPCRPPSNSFYQPAIIEVVADWHTAGHTAELKSPKVPMAYLADPVACDSRAHANRLKHIISERCDAQVEVLGGDELRYGWFDIIGFPDVSIWWPLMLQEAWEECMAWQRGFRVRALGEYQDDVRAIAAKLAKGGRR